MDGEVHDVLAIAEAVRSPVAATGHSSGAVVVLESALASPERFAGILLYEPPVAVTRPLGGDHLRRARRAAEKGDVDAAVHIFLREIVEVPAYVVSALKLIRPVWHRLRESAPAQIADTEAIESLGIGIERYRNLHVPALLLGGGFLSPRHASTRLDALAGVLPLVESRITLRFQGHGAHYSAPQKVANVVADFVARIGVKH